MKKINQIPMYIAVQLENTEYDRQMWLDLPLTRVAFANHLSRIQCINQNVRILGYSTCGTGLTRDELAKSPITTVNYLAHRLGGLNPDEVLKLRAITETEHYFDTAERVINYTFYTDGYKLLQGITDEEKLGWYYLGEPSFDFSVPVRKPISRYNFGTKLAESEQGVFVPQGYLKSMFHWENPCEAHIVPSELNLHGFLSSETPEIELGCD